MRIGRLAIRVLLAGCMLASSVPVLASGQPAAAGGQVEPGAATWRTWLLTTPSQVRVEPPPDEATTSAELDQLRAYAADRDPTAMERIRFWDAGAPGYRWNGIMGDELLKHNLTGGTRSRHWSLMASAIYDATIAAWDSKYTYQRARPATQDPTLLTAVETPRSPSYPSEHAAVAAAAAGVMAYLFPDDAQALLDKADEAAHSRELAGVQYPSDTAAGLAIGRQVAQLAVEHARQAFVPDHWDGSVPNEPGKWSLARYPAGAVPLEPQFGQFKPWVLSSGSELRPGPPPAFDSPEQAADLAEVVNFQRTFPTNAAAFYWQSPKGTTLHWEMAADQKIFEYRLDTNPPRAARVQALMNVAGFDAAVACWDAKYTYWRIRPFQADPSFNPLVTVPVHPSYPAAHGCWSGAQAAVLADLFPSDAAAFTAQAEEAGMARLWGGVHYPSDIRVGLALGRSVAQRVLDWSRSDGATQ